MSRVWYLVAGGLVMVAVAVGATGVMQASSTVEEMPRVVMPGRSEVVLPAGTTTLYLETESRVGGTAYVVPGEGVGFACAVRSEAGSTMPVTQPMSKVSYTIGGFSGRNAFDVEIASAGTYILTCDAPEGTSQFVIAIGRGIGTWIVVGIVGGLVPFSAAVVLALVVFFRRRRQLRAGAAG